MTEPTQDPVLRHRRELIQALYRKHETEDKPVFDNLLSLYQGKFWSKEGPLSMPGRFQESDMVKSSINMVFAITESSRSVLIPTNPQVTLRDGSNDASKEALLQEKVINQDLREANVAEELGMFVDDVVLFGRGIFKVGWDLTVNQPWAKVADINAVVFDREAKRVADIRYWCEATPLSKAEWEARFASGHYKDQSLKDKIKPSLYPSWLKRLDIDPNQGLQETEVWYLVYEFYDVEQGKVCHYSAECEHTLLEENLEFVPYVLGFFNHNKVDCGGLSEIMLIASNQAELNILRSMTLEVVRASIPSMLFDKGKVSSDELESIQQAPVGSFVGVALNGDNANLGNAFMPVPQPAAPNMLQPLMSQLQNDMAYVSALAEAQRGQVTGAKTATELAFIDAQLKNRLQSRQKTVERTIQRIAYLFLYLRARYQDDSQPPTVKLQDGPVQVTRDALAIQGTKFEVVPYSATPSNREVIRERFKEIFPLLVQDPSFDGNKVRKYFLDVMDLPTDFLAPPAPPAPPPAPGGMPPMPGPEQMVVPPTPTQPEPGIPPIAPQGA